MAAGDAPDAELARIANLELDGAKMPPSRDHRDRAAALSARTPFARRVVAHAWRERSGDRLDAETRAAARRARRPDRSGSPGSIFKPNRKPRSGTRLLREWKGQVHEVAVTADGYVWNGTQFRSLSMIANAITGTRWNGWVFFGVKKPRPAAPTSPQGSGRKAKRPYREDDAWLKPADPCAARSTPANRARKASSRISTRFTPSGRPARPISRARSMRAGSCCPPIMMMAVSRAGRWSGPGLMRLLADIASGRIDVVVVYKVDRLTRSLTDFARIVEVFDASNASFVSVTQAFNTTTSMGRLTLNVLLSFAQFEREVTGERIRDKIAASKKKGLWMGGTVPLGYRAAGRTLEIVEEEADLVRDIFRRYLELRSVDLLKGDLDRRKLLTPVRISPAGRRSGGGAFSRGHLYRVLTNPLYRGCIRHKDILYDGQHTAIIDDVLSGPRLRPCWTATGRERGSASEPGMAPCSPDCCSTSKVSLYARHMRTRRVCATAATITVASAKDAARRPLRLGAVEVETAVLALLRSLLSDRDWLAGQLPGECEHRRPAGAPRASRSLEQGPWRERPGAKCGRPSRNSSTGSRSLGRQSLSRSTGVPCSPRRRLATQSRSTSSMRCPSAGAAWSPDLSSMASTRPRRNPTPLCSRALAQAHRWWRDLLERRYPTMRDLARGLSDR